MNQSLLAKYLAGSCSEDERKAVEAWAESDAKHAAELNRMRSIWDGSAGKEVDYQPDTDAAWEKIRSKIVVEETVVKPMWQRPILWQIAAAVIILVAIGAYLGQGTASVDDVKWNRIATADEVKTFTLKDGTKVTLNRNSALEMPAQFGEVRETRLEGEAFFSVAKDPKHPFVVNANGSNVRVLGTRFSIRQNGNVEVVVEEGKVAFSGKMKSDSVHLTAGQAAILPANAQSPNRQANPDPNLEAWRTGKLVFEDAPLTYALEMVQKAYGLSVSTEIEMPACKINGSFNKMPVDQVLAVVAAAIGASPEQEGDNWKLYGGDCK
ncbi:MAG: FecR domain-containing protein [Bacteroidia bacterium]